MLAWERQENESDKAYYAFSVYRDLGPGRSLRAVAEAVYGPRWEHGKRTVEGWSSRFDWVSRVRALDARDEMLRREAVERHEETRAVEFAERQMRIRGRLLDAAEQLVDQAEKMLSWPLSEQRIIREGEDGEEQVLIVQPARWNKGTVVQFLHSAAGAVAGAWSMKQIEEPDEEEWDFDDLTEEEVLAYIEITEKLGVKPPKRS